MTLITEQIRVGRIQNTVFSVNETDIFIQNLVTKKVAYIQECAMA